MLLEYTYTTQYAKLSKLLVTNNRYYPLPTSGRERDNIINVIFTLFVIQLCHNSLTDFG